MYVNKLLCHSVKSALRDAYKKYLEVHIYMEIFFLSVFPVGRGPSDILLFCAATELSEHYIPLIVQ